MMKKMYFIAVVFVIGSSTHVQAMHNIRAFVTKITARHVRQSSYLAAHGTLTTALVAGVQQGNIRGNIARAAVLSAFEPRSRGMRARLSTQVSQSGSRTSVTKSRSASNASKSKFEQTIKDCVSPVNAVDVQQVAPAKLAQQNYGLDFYTATYGQWESNHHGEHYASTHFSD